MPTASAPTPRRRGRSVGCIILYVCLALALLFTGLCVALYEVGSHVLANSAATRTAATRLYQQVTSQPPTIQDLLAGPGANSNWSVDEESTYSCELAGAALHVAINGKGEFGYCIDTTAFSTDLAFQAQMQVVSGDAGGLAFRITPSADGSTDGFYFFEVNLQGNYAVYLHKNLATKSVSPLAAGITQAIYPQLGRMNTITAIAKGSVFNLYINQQFVVQVQNGLLKGAMVGVISSDFTHPTTVVYSNIKLWDLDS